MADDHYVHGTDPEEQRRLSRLNALLNAASLQAAGLRPGERVLDVGSGLGQLTRMMARRVGPAGRVVGVERDRAQLREARTQAEHSGEGGLVEFRQGEAEELPLADDEWGTFDVVHARFVLEHVTDPGAVVRVMTRAARPGGRILLEDDDHDVLRLSPDLPGVIDLWRAYYRTYERQGKDPYVGRHLVTLLREAGARPESNRCLFFGSCAGSPNFEAMVTNFIQIIDGARREMVEFGLADEAAIDDGLASFRAWMERSDAALWYSTYWAEGAKPSEPSEPGGDAPSHPLLCDRRDDSGPTPAASEPKDEATLLRFLMRASAELNSSLSLDEVFHKIATEIRPLIDYHLFCIGLWNESSQLLEHSFSMKYGEAIPQKGGFPLGYGLSGTAAMLRRPVRVANVLEDERYVRYRHPEVEIHSELAVPLIFHDQLIGVIDLESTEFDYFTPEHEQTVSTLASHIAVALVNARLHETVVRDEQRHERDLATARDIQHGLLPQSPPTLTGVEIGVASTPARELGGDFFDFLPYGENRVAVAIGDVVGKATPAALLGSLAVGMLRGHVVERPQAPADMLSDLNDHLVPVGGDNRFVAMMYAVVDGPGRTIEFANAGLPYPRIVRNGSVLSVSAHGVPLGLFRGVRYDTGRIEFAPGDVLVCCSDGLLECEDEQERTFEAERLDEVLLESAGFPAHEIAVRLNAAAVRFADGTRSQQDDYTIVVVKAAP